MTQQEKLEQKKRGPKPKPSGEIKMRANLFIKRKNVEKFGNKKMTIEQKHEVMIQEIYKFVGEE